VNIDPIIRKLGRRTFVLLHPVVVLGLFAGHRSGFDVLLNEVEGRVGGDAKSQN